jgi:hypothetical protein
MDTFNVMVFRRNGQWRLDRPSRHDITQLSRPCALRWTLRADVRGDWRFDRPPLTWKPGSGESFEAPVLSDDSTSFTVHNANTGGRLHHYTLHFRRRSDNAPDLLDPSIQNWPRPSSERIVHPPSIRDVALVVGAGLLLGLLLARKRGEPRTYALESDLPD